jgi:SnoaL-like domain
MPTRRSFMTVSALAASSLVPSISFSVAAMTPNQTAFNNAITAFNNQDWNAMAALLEDDVVLVTVKQGQLVRRKRAVMHYLMNNVSTDKERFFEDTSKTVWPSPNVVTGRALWVDADYPGCSTQSPYVGCGTISFFFRFSSNNLLDRMYGTADG